MDEPRETRPDDALVEPLFAGLLHQPATTEDAPRPRRGWVGRSVWIACALLLLAGALAYVLSL